MIRILTVIAVLFSTPAWAEEVAPGVFRTPDARFESLADFPFEPNYLMVDGLRVHYLDEGPEDGDPILLLHGEPTWGYLFRTMIPVLTAAGHRDIVPDMIGFGRSDKLASIEDYSYPFHVDKMGKVVSMLDLQNATFFGQDWGGLIGLRVVAEQPDRFARVVVSNTGLPAASGMRGYFGYPIAKLLVWWEGAVTWQELQDEPSFVRWMAHAYHDEDLDVGQIMQGVGSVSDAAVPGYEAPFPDHRYKAGAQIFPYLVPSQLLENEAVWTEVYEKWEKPFLVAFTDSDPITAPMKKDFVERIPSPQVVTIKGPGHFVQEEAGPELAALINDFIAGKPLSDFEVVPSAGEGL